jgi:RNA ligase (TIGR02306 family)
MTRKMAWIVKIEEITPIINADSICAYRVGGWWVVDRKDSYAIGDLCVYVTIDSWVPNTIAPFLTKPGQYPKVFEGVEGERLRTARLRGKISQGLLLPVETVLSAYNESIHSYDDTEYPEEGHDVSSLLGIVKWEASIPANLAGTVRGQFPAWGRRTDAERCQNLISEIASAYENDVKFEVTIKLDGTSMSIGMSPEKEFYVCSRNLALNHEQSGNVYVDLANKYSLEEKLGGMDTPLLISGEAIGPGIQKNQEKLTLPDFFVFNIWCPIRSTYIPREERMKIVNELGLKHVPVLYESVTLRELNCQTIDQLLKFAEGPSLHAPSREGVVFKSLDGSLMFKAISNTWLLKND